MEEKFNEATELRPQGKRTLDAALVTLDMDHFIKQIRNEQTWLDSDRNAITVFKSMAMRLVLIALHKGAEMKKHTAAATISVQVIEGEILFTTDEQTITLTSGKMLLLHEGISHSVVAAKETVFLLTLTASGASAGNLIS
ncbi:MAG: cupin domain-containing protein [Ferruginibacter sp.]